MNKVLNNLGEKLNRTDCFANARKDDFGGKLFRVVARSIYATKQSKKRLKLVISYMMTFLLVFFELNAVFADPYNLYKPGEYVPNQFDKVDEKVLFILDFSQSMTEEIQGERKVDLMLKTMSEILPTINKNVWVGLRVYGHRNGFTQYDACKASTLLVPITPASAPQIELKLSKTNPRGMTPITYSLKQATSNDFAGYSGKKHIILLTDGGENCDESPCTWVMELVKTRKDVKIDVIAFNIEDKDDLDQLQCTALVTTGKFYSANTAADLVRSLQKSLNTSKKVEAKIILNK